MSVKLRVYVEDQNGSFRQFLKNAPKEARSEMSHAVRLTTFAIGQRMRATAPKLTGDMAKAIEDRPPKSGLTGRVGLFVSEEAEVALYNEYRPNEQPFMRPAADAEGKDFVRRATDGLRQAERNLSIGKGML